MSKALESRELQPLRDYLKQLGPDALPAIEEWAKANEYAVVKTVKVNIDPELLRRYLENDPPEPQPAIYITTPAPPAFVTRTSDRSVPEPSTTPMPYTGPFRIMWGVP